jgi:hypothetical protein
MLHGFHHESAQTLHYSHKLEEKELIAKECEQSVSPFSSSSKLCIGSWLIIILGLFYIQDIIPFHLNHRATI